MNSVLEQAMYEFFQKHSRLLEDQKLREEKFVQNLELANQQLRANGQVKTPSLCLFDQTVDALSGKSLHFKGQVGCRWILTLIDSGTNELALRFVDSTCAIYKQTYGKNVNESPQDFSAMNFNGRKRLSPFWLRNSGDFTSATTYDILLSSIGNIAYPVPPDPDLGTFDFGTNGGITPTSPVDAGKDVIIVYGEDAYFTELKIGFFSNLIDTVANLRVYGE